MANRVIKFRAWDGVQMWYQGQGKTTLMFWGQPGKIPFGIYEETDGRRIMTGDDKAILNNPAILMQFTGLTDKNGVEIYEGDLIKHENGFIYPVEYGEFVESVNGGEYTNTCFGFHLANCELEDFDQIHNKHKVEVIGNIYENPELLNP